MEGINTGMDVSILKGVANGLVVTRYPANRKVGHSTKWPTIILMKQSCYTFKLRNVV